MKGEKLTVKKNGGFLVPNLEVDFPRVYAEFLCTVYKRT